MRVYSDLLKKPFDTAEELEKAEAEYKKAHEAELQAKEERAIAAAKVDEAFAALHEFEKEARQGIEEIKQECAERIANVKKNIEEYREDAEKALTEFCEKYGPYHHSIDISKNPHWADGFLNSFFEDFFRIW